MKAYTLLALAFAATTATAAPNSPGRDIYPQVRLGAAPTSLVGETLVDATERTITANVYHDICQSLTRDPGQKGCLAIASLEASYLAPIVNTSFSCGSVYTTASDGRGLEIEIADHRRRTCMDMPAGLITVRVQTQSQTYEFVKQ